MLTDGMSRHDQKVFQDNLPLGSINSPLVLGPLGPLIPGSNTTIQLVVDVAPSFVCESAWFDVSGVNIDVKHAELQTWYPLRELHWSITSATLYKLLFVLTLPVLAFMYVRLRIMRARTVSSRPSPVGVSDLVRQSDSVTPPTTDDDCV